MALKKIGTMQCPQGAVVMDKGNGSFSIENGDRCKGKGPVFSDSDRPKILILECPEGKKEGERQRKHQAPEGKLGRFLHDGETVEMRKDIWASQVKK